MPNLFETPGTGVWNSQANQPDVSSALPWTADIAGAYSASSSFNATYSANNVAVGVSLVGTVTWSITDTSCPSDIWVVVRIASAPDYHIYGFPSATQIFTESGSTGSGTIDINLPEAFFNALVDDYYVIDVAAFDQGNPSGSPVLQGYNVYGSMTVSIEPPPPECCWTDLVSASEDC